MIFSANCSLELQLPLLLISIFSKHRCCVFWSAFGCYAHPKAVDTNFFQLFSTFFVHFIPCQVRQIQGTPSGSRLAFACQPALKSSQKLKKLDFVHYQMLTLDFRRDINKKGLILTRKDWKRLKKVFRPAFNTQRIE